MIAILATPLTKDDFQEDVAGRICPVWPDPVVFAKRIAPAIEVCLREWRKQPPKVVLENGCPKIESLLLEGL